MYVFVLIYFRQLTIFILILHSSNSSKNNIFIITRAWGQLSLHRPHDQVVHRACAHPHSCNVTTTGDGGKAYRADADNLYICKTLKLTCRLSSVYAVVYSVLIVCWTRYLYVLVRTS